MFSLHPIIYPIHAPFFFQSKPFGLRVGQDIALQMWLRVVKQLGKQMVMEKHLQRHAPWPAG
jgi:hypothetical protein